VLFKNNFYYKITLYTVEKIICILLKNRIACLKTDRSGEKMWKEKI